jgi:hypothetical protein
MLKKRKSLLRCWNLLRNSFIADAKVADIDRSMFAEGLRGIK